LKHIVIGPEIVAVVVISDAVPRRLKFAGGEISVVATAEIVPPEDTVSNVRCTPGAGVAGMFEPADKKVSN